MVRLAGSLTTYKSLNNCLADDVKEVKYEFEPTLEASTHTSATPGDPSRPPRWKEVEFLSRVVAFSGATAGLVAFVSADDGAKTEGKASAAVCLFAAGVYRFRVRVWGSSIGGGQREASCVVRVQL